MKKHLPFDEGVEQIVECLRFAKGSTPCVALVGAGISYSAGIPLGWELVREAHAKFRAACRGIDPASPFVYGLTMRRLDPQQRKQLLQPHIAGAKINWANIALAQLLASGYLSRILTANFDPLLAKASGLLGHYPAIYDFGAAPFVNVAEMAEPAIIHLHGQSTGFVLLNTDEETKKHAERLRPLILHTVQRAPILVVGYSGAADALLDVLRDCYDSTRRLYWLDLAAEPSPAIKAFLEPHEYAHYVGEADADRTLVALCQQLQCFPPKIFDDPVGHLMDCMAPVADFPRGKAGQSIQLIKRNWLRDMEALRGHDTHASGTERQITRLLIEGRDDAALDASTGLDELSNEISYWTAIEVGNKAFHQGEAESEPAVRAQRLTAACDKYQQAFDIKPNRNEALYNWGNALASWAQSEPDEAARNARFAQASEKYQLALDVKDNDPNVLYNWGVALARWAQIADTDLAVRAARFQNACDKYERAVDIKYDMHEAFNNWGLALADWARIETDPVERAARFTDAYEKFETALDFRPDMHEALYNWGTALADRGPDELDAEGRTERLMEACEKFQRSLSVKPDNADAYYNWGTALASLAEKEENQVLRAKRLAAASDKFEHAFAIKPDHQDALNNWGAVLMQWAKLEPERRDKLFDEAETVMLKVHALDPTETYNLACLAALRGDEAACARYLLTAWNHGKLPDRKHLMEDTDLDLMRGSNWFTDILTLSDRKPTGQPPAPEAQIH